MVSHVRRDLNLLVVVPIPWGLVVITFIVGELAFPH